MQHTIAHSPTFTTLEFTFEEGERIITQPGCMLAMTTGLDLEVAAGSHMKGKSGFGGAARSMLAGESFFTSVYTAKRSGERLILAPNDSGEIRGIEVKEGARYHIASGGFLACTTDVQMSLKYAGVKGWMATRGFFLMRTEGEGTVFIASFGALVEHTLAEGERFVLDNRYIVAFTDTMKYELVKVAKTLKGSYFSGEGLVNRFTGPGTILYQTRGRPSRGFLQSMLNIAT
jgi:uncharacterized protein (TIGR00266 family)